MGERDAGRVFVDDLDGLDVRVALRPRRDARVSVAIERKLDVVCGELADSLVPLHAFADMELVYGAVRRQSPAFCQRRKEVGRHGARGVADETLVYHGYDRCLGGDPGERRVEAANISGRDRVRDT